MTEAENASQVGNRAWVWPALIVGLLTLNVIVVTITVIVATSDPSVAVEPNYYDKALAWDRERAERRDPAEDGYDVEIQLVPAADRLSSGQVVVSLRRLGQPVEHALLDATVFHYARSGDRQSITLTERAPGVYAADADLRRNGNWEVRLRLQADGQRYQFTRLAELYGVKP
ncbi:MAG: hypothetical protein Kow0022_00760 [Phycisphaerales bacterium]